MSVETPVGVYRLFDAAGLFLYVGVGEHPPTRWADHRRKKSWWPDVDETRTTVEWFANRELALAEETRVIAEEFPLHNKAGTLKMRRPLDPARPVLGNYAGAAEIRAALGVSRQRVQQIVTDPGFPAPRWELVMGRVWYGPDVAAWMAANRLTA